jgi:hypothetical protein
MGDFEIIESSKVAAEKAIMMLRNDCICVEEITPEQKSILTNAFEDYMEYNNLTYEDIESLILDDKSIVKEKYGNNKGWEEIDLALNRIFDNC